ncbi:ABC transporter permease [Jiangella alba]|uniref:Peptide/nickel transport system permease protein n=1 Tax=Jiangella alba TaxID=561176 RepID=A0A1H5KZF2_9ACTN|nr:ABC transporter permease [Jiangella alba]SEE70094.1 peptide/nickel transport system permease protein [Jiangella alba]
MLRFTARRLLHAVPLLFGVVTLMFFLLQLAPGDPIQALIGDYPATPEYIAQVTEAYGLDQPLLVRYWEYLQQIFTLNLGESLAGRVPVADLIADRLGNTLILTITAMTFAAIVGVAVGVWAGVSRSRALDHLVTGVAVGSLSIPMFWLGQMLVLVFAIKLSVLPSQGMYSTRSTAEGLDRLPDLLTHLLLPALVLAMREIGVVARIVRTSVHDVLTLPYVETARAKGFSRATIIRRHVVRNSLLPAVTVIGYNFGFVLAGSVLVETVFGWPGMGQLLYESIRNRDNAVTIGIVLLIAVAVVVVNLITDLVYGLVDPRIRVGAGAGGRA